MTTATKPLAKPLTKRELAEAIRMLERARNEHDRLFYATGDSRSRMENHASHQCLIWRYDAVIQALRYAAKRTVGIDLKQLFEYPEVKS